MRLSLMNRKLIAHRVCAGHCLNVPSVFFCGAVFICDGFIYALSG